MYKVNGRAATPFWMAGVGGAVAVAIVLMHPEGRADPAIQLGNLWARTFHYLLFAVIAYVVFWIALDRLLARRKLSQVRWPARRQVLSEAAFSSVTNALAVGLGLWLATWLFPQMRENVYRDIGESGWAYYAAWVFGVFVLHDTYFYWAHRLLHWRPLFVRFHRTHHESREPTPFTTFHFHPVEGMIEVLGGWVVAVPMLFLPWHDSLLAIWFFGMLFFNTIGHLGYELYPRWWHRVPIVSFKTTCMHHYMHHQRYSGNYALYFRFWDRLCGTEFDDYETRYDKMFAKSQSGERRTAQAPN